MSEVLIAQNLAPAALTSIPTTDTAVFSVNIKPNNSRYTRIVVRNEITTTASSLTNTVTFKLKLNGTTLVDDFQSGGTANFLFKTDAVARINQFYCEWIGDVSVGGTITLTVSASVLDSNTTITPKAMYVYAIN